MKLHTLLLAASLISTSIAAEDVPSIFAGLLKKDIPLKGEVGMVAPPAEIDRYIAKVEVAARKDPQWFQEYSASAKPGIPLPFHENLGLTKEEYSEYLRLWNSREFKAIEEVMLLLRKSSTNTWTITSTGAASTISTLRYYPDTDSFNSPNGDMKRIDDIAADANSILGRWNGKEWKFEEETNLSKIKENLAIGKYADTPYGLIVYRAQEVSSTGTRFLDKSLVIRFPLPKDAAKK